MADNAALAQLAQLLDNPTNADNPLVVVLKQLLNQPPAAAAPAPKTPRDLAYEAVKDQGYGLAKGGELLISLDTLQAAARAVRNESVEIVDAPKTESNTKRNISKVVAYKVDDQTIALHTLYKLA